MCVYVYMYSPEIRLFILRLRKKMVLKTECEKYKKTKKIQNCVFINTGWDVQKQHSESDMRVIPIYHVSQSGIRIIKLLRQELPRPATEVQWSPVNVKMWLKSINCKNVNQDFISEVKSVHCATVSKHECRALEWRLQNLSDWASKISNSMHQIIFVHEM